MKLRELVLGVLAACSGCVEKGPEIDDNFVKQNLMSAEPAPKHKVNADLGGKVVYLGADVDKDQLKPGDKLVIVHYWKVVQPPGGEWRVFTHVDGATKNDWINADGSKMRSNHPPDRWKAGEIFRDEQTVTLKADWSSPFAAIHVGLYKKGSANPKDRLPIVAGPNDGQQRVQVAKLPVSGAAAKPATPAAAGYVIRKAAAPLTIDGKGDEPAWAQAASTGPWQTAEGGDAVEGETTAKLLWDDKTLYALIDVKDKDVHSSYTKHDDPLWKEDVVELFIDANRDRRGYVELQVNPNNAQFDSFFSGGNRQNPDPAWNANMKTAVVVTGTKDKRDDQDTGWTVEMAIPLEAVKGKDAAMALSLPPKPGDKWRLNGVRVEKPKEKGIAAASWAHITIQDFHAIDRLIEVTFGDEKGQAAAAPIVPGPAPAAGAPAPMKAPEEKPVQVAPPGASAKPATPSPPSKVE
jgi:hypothetical protein